MRLFKSFEVSLGPRASSPTILLQLPRKPRRGRSAKKENSGAGPRHRQPQRDQPGGVCLVLLCEERKGLSLSTPFCFWKRKAAHKPQKPGNLYSCTRTVSYHLSAGGRQIPGSEAVGA